MASIIEDYFAAADEADAEACAALFTDDTVYQRQRLSDTGSIIPGMYELRGRAAVYHLLKTRSKSGYRHVMRSEARHGSEIFGEGYVQAPDGTITAIFLISVTVTEAGLISRSISIGSSAKGATVEPAPSPA